jgi:NAD(P)-dependent dehydrogenase (short-subunit alcohol dehydrogenase family)
MRVLVTGAASGIGRATCLRLARDGKAAGRAARVAAVDVVPPSQLTDLVASCDSLAPTRCPSTATWGRPTRRRGS